ncbi:MULTISPECIES: hypothetical protein [Photorhabdus]|uniref:Uncharacterized protein n=2 Tax=Photorhabdus TaxID=29487 RepID=A0AAW6BMY0_9GAMM|nr:MULTISPECIES: hypothetical protein [Photorhabdus]EYU16595.1 hypothetical protein BA1DRAFT_00879 [Photorhabdus aegyptia]MDB6373896.1 hypothetical protein [Photorhabdus bodei]
MPNYRELLAQESPEMLKSELNKRESIKSMVALVFATLIFDEFLACLNLSGVTIGKEPALDEFRAW